MSYRERVSDKLLKNLPKSKRMGKFLNGKFYSGTTSLHKTKAARKYNTLWRLVYSRNVK